MPGKHIVKEYVENGYYHIYNRGAHKNKIFFEDSDYFFFRNIMKKYLKQAGEGNRVLCFSILPNHYHLLLRQNKKTDMTKILKNVGVGYGLYLRSKYKHSGRVFQGQFRARYLKHPHEILQVKEYILMNAIKAGLVSWSHCGFDL